MRRTKILQVIHGLHIGGAEKVVVDLATQVDPASYESGVCCVNSRGVLADQLEAAGVSVLEPAKRGNLGSLLRNIRAFDPDIVHCHGTSALVHLGPLYAARRLPPLLCTFHQGNYPHIKRRYLYAERLFVRYASRLVAVAEYQRQTIIRTHRISPAAIQTVFNGVRANPFRGEPGLPSAVRAEFGFAADDIVVGCVAVLSEQKGIAYLLQAAEVLLEEQPQLRFLIVGGGPLQQALEAEAHARGLDRVHFAGWRDDVQRILPALDLFVMPSLWEAFSIVLLEAMAAGCTSIVTDVGDNARVISNGRTGLLIPPRDPLAIVRAVRFCLGNPDAARSMGAQAHEYYQRHLTVAQMAANYQNLYAELAAQSPVGSRRIA